MTDRESAPRGVWGVVKHGLVITRRTIGGLLPIYFICWLVSFAVAWYVASQVAGVEIGGNAGVDSLHQFNATNLCLQLVAQIVFFWAAIAAMWVAGADAAGREWSTGQAAVIGLRRFFPALVGFILSLLCIAVGYLLLIVPGIYLSVRLYLTTFMNASEGLGPIDGFNEGARLVKNNWWHTTGVLGVLFVISLVVGICFGLIHFALYPPVVHTAQGGVKLPSLSAGALFFNAINSVINLILLQIAIGVTAALAVDLRARHALANDASGSMEV